MKTTTLWFTCKTYVVSSQFGTFRNCSYLDNLSSGLFPFSKESFDFSFDFESLLSGTNFFQILMSDFAVAMTSSLSLDFL